MKVKVTRLEGLVSYHEALATQERICQELECETKRIVHLLLLQHRPVYTLGRMTKSAHLLSTKNNLALKADVVEVARGGSITYHGPGQLMAYVHLNLNVWGQTIHQHLWNLEEIVIHLLQALEISGNRIDGMTGIWVTTPSGVAKVCAMGVGCRKWVTFHGLGLNVDLDLEPYSKIDPCGLGKPVTSLAKLLNRSIEIKEVEAHLVKAVGKVES